MIYLLLSPAVPSKQKTKENQVPSHETGQLDDSQEDLEAETAPDLVEGDIAVSEVSNN